MADFDLRAVEVHSSYVWDFEHIMKVLDFAVKNNLNALVLHRNDIVEQVVYPGKQFGVPEGEASIIYERYRSAFRKIYAYTPTRRSGPLLRRGYLKRVVEEARRRGIEVYLQNKELSFPDILLELNPSLTKDGHICPNDPFWFDFLRTKYMELFEDIPLIAGIISSMGTGESRVSISSNRCTCDLCKSTGVEEWYNKIILTIHEVLKTRGKKYILRDFVFTKKDQDNLSSVFSKLPDDIIISIKDTPHDYYPTFPQNKLIGRIQDRKKWIEYDTMAQYFGWGIGPSTMIDYMKTRMTRARELGAEGIILRTDWESLDGHTSFHTPNILNLYAGAAFGVNTQVTEDLIYRTWLEDQGAFLDAAKGTDRNAAVSWIASIFSRNWEVIRKTLYVNECVFNDCSTFPVGFEQAIWLAEEKNSLKDWVPEKKDALVPTPENTDTIIREKDEALALVKELRQRILAYPGEIFKPAFIEDLKQRYEIFALYVKGFRVLVHLFALLRCAEAGVPPETMLPSGELKILFSRAEREAGDVMDEYDALFNKSSYPSSVYQLLNAERLHSFVSDVAGRWKGKTGL